MKNITIIPIILLFCSTAFAQNTKPYYLELPKERREILQKVTFFQDINSQVKITPKAKQFTIDNDRQRGLLTWAETGYNGSITQVKEEDSTVFHLKKSVIWAYENYKKGIINIRFTRNEVSLFTKAYQKDGITLRSEGEISLNKKYYLQQISTSYFSNGKIQSYSNGITGTEKEYYENGNLKEKTENNIIERYHQDGRIEYKQYIKNLVRYNEEYQGGKLYKREYKNQGGKLVVETYENGKLIKKDIAPKVEGVGEVRPSN